jgi:hypothetical protein
MYRREARDRICIAEEFSVTACVCVIEKKEPIKYCQGSIILIDFKSFIGGNKKQN